MFLPSVNVGVRLAVGEGNTSNWESLFSVNSEDKIFEIIVVLCGIQIVLKEFKLIRQPYSAKRSIVGAWFPSPMGWETQPLPCDVARCGLTNPQHRGIIPCFLKQVKSSNSSGKIKNPCSLPSRAFQWQSECNPRVGEVRGHLGVSLLLSNVRLLSAPVQK